VVRRVALPAHYWALLWVFGPIVVGAGVAVLFALLTGVQPLKFLTSALKWRFANIFNPSAESLDSWLPMIQGLGVLHGPDRSRLYETLFFDQTIRFQYPPTSLLPLDLLRHFNLLSVKLLNTLNLFAWAGIAVAMAMLSFVLFRPRASRQGDGSLNRATCDWRWMAVGAVGATFLFHPIIDAYALGQIQMWIDLAFALACLLWLVDERALAGACVAVACAIKPQFALLFIWGVAWREWRFVAGFFALIAPIGLLSLLLYGWHNHLAYIEVLSYISGHDESYFNNNSVNGILSRLLKGGAVWNPDVLLEPGNPQVAAATTVALILFALLGIGPAFIRGDRQANIFDFAAATLCFVIGAPIAWTHHYGVALPFFLVALKAVLDIPRSPARRNRLILLTAAWILLANSLPYINTLRDAPLNILQSYRFFGGLMLLFVLFAQSGTISDLKTRIASWRLSTSWRRSG